LCGPTTTPLGKSEHAVYEGHSISSRTEHPKLSESFYVKPTDFYAAGFS